MSRSLLDESCKITTSHATRNTERCRKKRYSFPGNYVPQNDDDDDKSNDHDDDDEDSAGAPNENIVQNQLNIALC